MIFDYTNMKCFRETTLLCLSAVALLCIDCSVFAAEINKWKDVYGKIHFGDRPPSNVEIERVTIKINSYTAPPIVDTLKADFGQSKTLIIYVTSWCPYCKRARKYFRSKQIRFKEYDVETSAKGRRDYKRLKAPGVPLILYGQEKMVGFDEAGFDEMYKQRY